MTATRVATRGSLPMSGDGPLRSLRCLAECRHSIDESCGAAGIPPRRAGNFFLLAQKEVTKKESLKTQRSSVPPYAQCSDASGGTPVAFSIPRTVGHQIGSETALAFESWAPLWVFAGRRAPIRGRPAWARMPERCWCQSGDRRFGVLRMPGACSQLCLRAGVTEALMNVWFSSPSLVTFLWLQESDPPAGAESRRSATKDHWPRQHKPKVCSHATPTTATGRNPSPQGAARFHASRVAPSAVEQLK